MLVRLRLMLPPPLRLVTRIIRILSASVTTTISLGSNTDLVSSAIVVASAAATITKGTGSSDLTVNVGITADGAITLNGGGSGTIM